MGRIKENQACRVIDLDCDCGCGIVRFVYFDDPDYDDVSVEYYPLGFWAHQKPFIERVKAIWKILFGKYFLLFDIEISRKEFEEKMKYLLAEKDK